MMIGLVFFGLDVEALLNEKAKRKDRFNYKVSWRISLNGDFEFV